MNNDVSDKKTVSFSQFSNWYTCEYKWYRDYILKEKVFEESLHMSFGTAIHETIQLYIKTFFKKSPKLANKINVMKYFTWAFKKEIIKKKIPHTPQVLKEFIDDGKNILNEFIMPVNFIRYFPRDKWELLAIEDNIKEEVKNNLLLDAKLDIVFQEKLTGNIRIVDFKTSTRGWTSEKEDFTKTSQLVLYKAIYSKRHNIPLNKIQIEFFILKRKLYENCNFAQSRLQIVKPSSFKDDVSQVIQEFTKFIDSGFTVEGKHNINNKFRKIPGKNKKNCKWCLYSKNGKCDQIPDIK